MPAKAGVFRFIAVCFLGLEPETGEREEPS